MVRQDKLMSILEMITTNWKFTRTSCCDFFGSNKTITANFHQSPYPIAAYPSHVATISSPTLGAQPVH